MKIGFIGAGKVGKTLGKYFMNHHIEICGYYSRNIDSALEAAQITDSIAFNYIEEIIHEANILFITTSDDAINHIVSEMVNSNSVQKEHIIIHTSGVHSTDVFEKLKHLGCGLYSIHPIQSIADYSTGIVDMKNTHFTIEGNQVHFKEITELFHKINNPYTLIDKDNKQMYHAGACVLSNYLVTLMNIGFEYIEASGFPKETIYTAFAPLIDSTLKNIKDMGAQKSLTGPICRGDVQTIIKHLNAIERNSKEELGFYKFMGLKTLEMVEKSSVLDEQKKTINKLLQEG